MKAVLTTIALAVAAVALVAPAEAVAKQDGVFCRAQDWSDGLRYKVKPRNCTLSSGEYGYQQAPIRDIRWRSWGGRSAYGRGTLLGNMGFRAPVRFKLYRPVHFEFGFYVYTKARGTTYFPHDAPIKWRKDILG
jgi:hypothetical protein